MDQSGTRLNKFLATHLGIGRREADNLIVKGQVLVNGGTPTLGSRVRQNDEVVVNGQPINTSQPEAHLYVLMNKPTGYVCSKRQQGDTPTIYSLLPDKYKHLKTVGRLDKDTSGIILLTNDGDLAHQLTHPKFAKAKEYEVTLNRPLQPVDLQALSQGVQLPDGPSQLKVASLGASSRHYKITMHEGRNRQIRRTFAALGYTVAKLHRTQFGEYLLGNLESGTVKVI